MFSGELSTPNLWSVQDSSPGTLQTFWESGKVENSPKIAGESEGLLMDMNAKYLSGPGEKVRGRSARILVWLASDLRDVQLGQWHCGLAGAGGRSRSWCSRSGAGRTGERTEQEMKEGPLPPGCHTGS